ncbi:hypothetical protein L2E82_10527 [Cichorium intybus]|uniref:Uncharacterized protein n=1 Tax=Cichorium intybus TaxID=13427 RepID=A0ACB9GBV5_CICIN|nr:hypothetical protein L2E82_10527 [Cichorium intybus]
MKDLFTKGDNEEDFVAELDRDANVLEEGGSGDVELDEERGVQKKYDSFDGGSKLSDEKKLLVQFLLRCSEDDDRRQDFESMRPFSPINRNVIDCWSCILNHQESLTRKSSRRFLYLNSSILTEDTLNVSTPSKRSYEIFNNRMERFISHVQRSLEFNELKLTVGYKKLNLIKKVTPRRVLVPWQETHATQDNGIFLMRHMETYIGLEDNNWTVGLGKQESKRDKRLTNLRILYIVRLAMHEININRSKLQEQVLEFGKIDFATRDSLMNKGMHARNIKEGLSQ